MLHRTPSYFLSALLRFSTFFVFFFFLYFVFPPAPPPPPPFFFSLVCLFLPSVAFSPLHLLFVLFTNPLSYFFCFRLAIPYLFTSFLLKTPTISSSFSWPPVYTCRIRYLCSSHLTLFFFFFSPLSVILSSPLF